VRVWYKHPKAEQYRASVSMLFLIFVGVLVDDQLVEIVYKDLDSNYCS
jgi:hypothetical protein